MKRFFAALFAGVIMITSITPTFAQEEINLEELVEGEDYVIIDYYELFEEAEQDELSENLPDSRLVRFVRNSRYVGKRRINMGPYVSGSPGTTISINQTASITYSVTNSLGATNGAISASIGTSISTTVSRTLGGSAPIPHTYGGRTVKSGRLQAQAESDYYAFEVHNLTKNLGTGYADVFRGVHYQLYLFY